MKKIALAAALSVSATCAFAGDANVPVTTEESVVSDSSSSAQGFGLVLLIQVALWMMVLKR